MFRAQLLREDVARLKTLVDLAGRHADRDAYVKAGTYIGWTNGDMRTHELLDELLPLMQAVHAYVAGGRTAGLDGAVRDAWDAFHIARMRKLIHCL